MHHACALDDIVTLIPRAAALEKEEVVRIVGGAFRGRALVAPKGQSTRPTADRARQAMFDVLEHAAWSRPLAGARALDLFAGSGALGLESLSRGAAHVLFVDRDAAAVAAIRANAAALKIAPERFTVLSLEATAAAIASHGPFDLVFLDPPYAQGLVGPALDNLAGGLADGALVIVEQGAGERSLAPDGLDLVDERRWGAAKVSFFRNAC